MKFLKKRAAILSIMLLGFLLFNSAPAANAYSKHGPTYVFIDGKEPLFTNDPFIKYGTTLIEFRPVFEMLGLQVGWDSKTKTVTGKKANLTIKMRINDRVAYVNNKKVILSQAPLILNGRTMVPLRFVAEASGKKVYWDGTTRMIIINDGNFTKADFTFNESDISPQLVEDAKTGKLGPFHASQHGKPLAQIVNKYGFPDARHDGTPYSDDIPFVIYGDYLMYYLGTKGPDYTKQPTVRSIHAILPEAVTNQDMIDIFGRDYKFDYGMYTNMIYDLGTYTVYIETEGDRSYNHPYYLSVGEPEWN
ncbi:copper amine oxidase-like protein [Cytobacillus oceanisediminis]|uniref:Copper amine oxidase-like protein n=1 Tax=Cytobacillus oceanisediminis TaxID=665099 RepID=A0A2V3A357_9BACI|nr:copper amine oxidase-like protein [Cytobacillus oceanisediminis]